jgi:hypothetical protein
MNTHDNTDLDTFDRALLTELRQVAAEVAPMPARRTRKGWAYAGSGVAAAAVAAFGLSTLGSPAAYAVDEQRDGDIVITIHELDDADGLERALAEHGIEAEVDYDSEGIGGVTIEGAPDLPEGTGEVGADVIQRRAEQLPDGERGTDEKYSHAIPGELPADHPCGGLEDLPFETALGSDDYVITIPSDSVIHESDVVLKITTSGAIADKVAGIQVAYSIGDVDCAFGSATLGTGGN